MYEPKYYITNKVLSNIVKLELAAQASRDKGLNYQMKSAVLHQNKAQNLFHLANSIGVNVTLRDGEKLAEGKNLEIDDLKLRILHNYRNVLEFNRSNIAEGYADIDVNVLTHLNKIMLTGWKETWEVALRETIEAPDTTFDDWVQMANISDTRVESEVNEALSWYRTGANKINTILRVAVIVYRLAEIMPFVAGNKLTIIAAADMLLYQNGYLSNMEMPIMRIFDQKAAEIMRIWEVCRQNQDITYWMEEFTAMLSEGIVDARLQLDQKLAAEEEKNTKQPFLDLNSRQLKILKYLQNIPTVKREDYCQMMDVSTMTAFRDLNDLVHKKLVRIEGKGRGTKYLLASR